MKETQQSIVSWQDTTFGKPHSLGISVARLNKEMGELIEAVALGKSLDKIATECADVLVVLYGVIDQTGYGLHFKVDEKMQVNRERSWYIDGTGHGQHISDD